MHDIDRFPYRGRVRRIAFAALAATIVGSGLCVFNAARGEGPTGPANPSQRASEFGRGPIEPELNPYWQAHVNRQRDYDFYAKQAIRYGAPGSADTPEIIPPYPGLDGGPPLYHWGNQNEQTWRNDRVNEMDFGSMIGGVFRGGGKTIARAVAVKLADGYFAVFDLDTLTFESAWRGAGVRWSDVRSGLINGMVIANDPLVEMVAIDRPGRAARYIGLHRRGAGVVFEYEVDGRRRFRHAVVRDGKVHEMESSELARVEGDVANWPRRLLTRGVLGEGSPYATDTLTLPYDNPWKALLFVGGVDFVSPRRIAICTLHGDVWIVDVLRDDLSHLRWKRFAAGLHQPAGLKVVDGVIHVMCRDQLVALRDGNGDDEADFYECVSMAHVTSQGGHDFVTGLERDSQGRWYFASGNQGLCRITSDGKTADVLATGFRNPNGLGVSPDGSVVLTSVQEGTWTPASAVCDASWGGYFGSGGPRGDQPPGYTRPMLYLPRGADNSSAGQTYIDSDRWGPARGRWLHQSFGAAKHFLLLREVVGERSQAAAIPLPGEFLSGAHRARFSPYDGQLYVAGSQGWGSYSTADGSLQRVRYTGGDYPYPIAWETRDNGILLTFASPRPEQIADARKWFAQQWSYRYTANYGSPEISVHRPDTQGHDRIDIRSVHRLGDGSRVFIEIPQLGPVDQLHLHFNGAPRVEMFATIHRLAQPFTDFPGYTRIAKSPSGNPLPDVDSQVTVATCVACHPPMQRGIGPSLAELRQRYAGNPDGIVAQAMNPQKKDPNLPPMPSFAFLGEEKLREIAEQILTSDDLPAP